MIRACSALVLFVRSHLESVVDALSRTPRWDLAARARARGRTLALRARWCAIETLHVQETGRALEEALLRALEGRQDKVNALAHALGEPRALAALEDSLARERDRARIRHDALVESLAALGRAEGARQGGDDGRSQR